MDSGAGSRQHERERTDGRQALITIETPVLGTEGARTFDSYYARPASGRGPGLVILTEMWGVAVSKRDMAEEYAAKGWCAVVPNLFWQIGRTHV